MLACCLLPVVVLGLVYVFGVSLNSVVWGVTFLLCPLSHILMMKYMGHNHEASHSASNQTNMLKDSSHGHHES
jgi:hypothetical protein